MTPRIWTKDHWQLELNLGCWLWGIEYLGDRGGYLWLHFGPLTLLHAGKRIYS